jgi:DNA-binding NarL/FixJ family response regulator
MSISIPNSFPTTQPATPNAAPSSGAAQNARAAQPVQQSAARQTDTVTLTEAQQVYQLYNQGQQVPQIATNLRLSVSAVDNYLGINNSTS